jgi:hypothetical protein
MMSKPMIPNYLIGFYEPADEANRSLTRGGIWMPLEKVIAPRCRVKFRYVDKTEALGVLIYRYQNDLTKEYVIVDEQGNLYSGLKPADYRPITMNDARLFQVPNTIQAVADGRL